MIFELLSHNANPNLNDSGGEPPLLKILLGGLEPLEKYRRDAMALLLYFQADVNFTPLGTLNKSIHLAVRRQDPWAVGMLLEKGALVDEPNGAGNTPLAVAVNAWDPKMTEDQKEVAYQLLDNGAAVNQRIGSSGKLALHAAIAHSQVDITDMLLFSFSADPLANNGAGLNAFQVAQETFMQDRISREVHQDILVSLLEAIDHPILVDSAGKFSMTDLLTSDPKAIKFLLQNNVYSILDDGQGSLLTHLASSKGDLQIMETLLQYPICSEIARKTDGNGKTALEVAQGKGDDGMVQLLKRHLSTPPHP